MAERRTHLGPPHSVAEALTTGNAEMATGSMVSELFSTALCTRCDSCGKQERAVNTEPGEEPPGEEPPAGASVREPDLRSGEAEAGAHVFSVDAAQEGRRVVQTRVFLPQQELGVQDRVHLQRGERV